MGNHVFTFTAEDRRIREEAERWRIATEVMFDDTPAKRSRRRHDLFVAVTPLALVRGPRLAG